MKERIIGAVVLVLIVVLVVPVFLDGPPQQGEVTSERLLLPGQNGQDTKTVVLNRERSAPIPPAEDDNAARDSSEPVAEQAAEVVVEAPPANSPPPVAETTPVETKLQPEAEDKSVIPTAEVSATGMWAVQLGSFSNEDNAEKLAASLRKQGYAAFVSQHSNGAKQFYRVRIGPQKDRESANAMAAKLEKVGHTGQVLPHP